MLIRTCMLGIFAEYAGRAHMQHASRLGTLLILALHCTDIHHAVSGWPLRQATMPHSATLTNSLHPASNLLEGTCTCWHRRTLPGSVLVCSTPPSAQHKLCIARPGRGGPACCATGRPAPQPPGRHPWTGLKLAILLAQQMRWSPCPPTRCAP